MPYPDKVRDRAGRDPAPVKPPTSGPVAGRQYGPPIRASPLPKDTAEKGPRLYDIWPCGGVTRPYPYSGRGRGSRPFYRVAIVPCLS